MGKGKGASGLGGYKAGKGENSDIENSIFFNKFSRPAGSRLFGLFDIDGPLPSSHVHCIRDMSSMVLPPSPPHLFPLFHHSSVPLRWELHA